MSSRVAWQGSLRSRNSNAGPEKMASKKGSSRSALGDISNHTTRSGTSYNAGGKKSSKPFSVATGKTNKQSITNEQEKKSSNGDQPSNVMIDGMNPAEPVDEVDIPDMHNPKYAAEYVNDIYKFYKESEDRYVASPNYMSKQTDINEKMRELLIDWLIQVHARFELLPQTLYLTVNILDRFLERKVVSRRKLQLVGCASMLLASKYEEIYAPEFEDFVSMSDNAFKADDLLKMEGVILNTLKFNLTVPTTYAFLRRYLKVSGASPRIQHHATYMIERSLQEYSLLKFLPSTLASAAVLLAHRANDVAPVWSPVLERHTRYTESQLQQCCDTLKHVVQQGDRGYFQTVKKKYTDRQYMSVANIQLE